ncbi:hypothetical protein ABZ806_15270 [Spirillospora sp. NPDC047418]
MGRRYDLGAGGVWPICEPQFGSPDRFELARDLVDNLSDAGLCAASTWEWVPSTVSVSARLVGTDPRSNRTVWCLPWPGRHVLYWQWRRTASRGGVDVGGWFEPLCPVADIPGAASHLIAAVRLVPDLSP